MSQQEFDTYLSLLCRLLRIAPQQREQVAEEFRAHMEDRLEELLVRGMDREAAVKLALEEFGDAAGLAAQIASISQGRRKRWIMRIGTVSVVGLAAAGLLAVALWPDGARVKAPQVVAQTGDKPGVRGEKPAKEERMKSVEEKLAERIDADYAETPLKELLDDLRERTGIQMYLNSKAIRNEVEEALGFPITISLKQVRLDMVLDLVLEQAGDHNLAYVERDGILIISTSEALSGASEVKVYNCRDLLAMASPVPQGGGMMGGWGGMGPPGGMMPGGAGGNLGLPSVPAENQEAPLYGPPGGEESPRLRPPGSRKPKDPRLQDDSPAAGAGVPEIPKGIAPQFGGGGGGGIVIGGTGAAGGMGAGGGGMGGGGMGGMAGGGGPSPPRTDEEIRAERLMHLITTAVKPDSWQDMGGFGTISEYKGLIVINHNARTHKEVENVLKMLREAAGLPDSGPKGGMMGPMMMPGGGGPPGGVSPRR
jgi:hypothetical protein